MGPRCSLPSPGQAPGRRQSRAKFHGPAQENLGTSGSRSRGQVMIAATNAARRLKADSPPSKYGRRHTGRGAASRVSDMRQPSKSRRNYHDGLPVPCQPWPRSTRRDASKTQRTKYRGDEQPVRHGCVHAREDGNTRSHGPHSLGCPPTASSNIADRPTGCSCLLEKLATSK